MPAYATIPEAVVDHLVGATREVFETMVLTSLRTDTPIDGDALRPRSNVVGTVSFAGSERGLVAFYSTLECARAIAAALIGGPVDLEDEIADAIGEITNMIAGTFRNRMAGNGAAWAISIPTVTLGSDFYTRYVSSVQRILCPFRMENHEIFVELIIMCGGQSHASTH